MKEYTIKTNDNELNIIIKLLKDANVKVSEAPIVLNIIDNIIKQVQPEKKDK